MAKQNFNVKVNLNDVEEVALGSSIKVLVKNESTGEIQEVAKSSILDRTLQEVTDTGNTTDNGIVLSGEVDDALIEFKSDGNTIGSINVSDAGERVYFSISPNETQNAFLDAFGLAFDNEGSIVNYSNEGVSLNQSGTPRLQTFQDADGVIALNSYVDSKATLQSMITSGNAVWAGLDGSSVMFTDLDATIKYFDGTTNVGFDISSGAVNLVLSPTATFIIAGNYAKYASGWNVGLFDEDTLTPKGYVDDAVSNVLVDNIKYGTAVLTTDGVQTTFNIPHGMGSVPSSMALTGNSNAVMNDFFTTSRSVDATNITFTTVNPPAAGSITVYWQVFK